MRSVRCDNRNPVQLLISTSFTETNFMLTNQGFASLRRDCAISLGHFHFFKGDDNRKAYFSLIYIYAQVAVMKAVGAQ